MGSAACKYNSVSVCHAKPPGATSAFQTSVLQRTIVFTPMASVWLLVVTSCAFYACCWAIALPKRPDLGAYQDVAKCSYPGSTWHVLYQTTKLEAFGNDDRCLRKTQMTDVVDDKARIRFRFGDGHELNATFHFKAKDGVNYDAFGYLVDGAKDIVQCNVLYLECDQCKITMCPANSECQIAVRESGLRHGVPKHCEFIYDMLCGTSPKYHTSDASCAAD